MPALSLKNSMHKQNDIANENLLIFNKFMTAGK